MRHHQPLDSTGLDSQPAIADLDQTLQTGHITSCARASYKVLTLTVAALLMLLATPGTSMHQTGLSRVTPGANFWNGDICEVLVYDTNLSVADINLIGPYLATKWGITWTTATR